MSAATSPAPGSGFLLGRRRIYVLPTRHGMAFAGALLVMLLGSANYGNGLGYALTFLLASLAIVSTLHAYRNLAGLRLSVTPGAAAFAGETGHFELLVDNTGQRARHALVARIDGRGRADAAGRVVHFDVDAGAVARLALPVLAERRGWLRVERVVIATRFPLGIFRAWSRPPVAGALLVYPRPVGDRPPPAARSIAAGDGGRPGAGRDDFAGLREYRRGDAPAHVHWKAFAREQGMLTKQFSGGTPAELDLSLADTVGPLEERLSQLARWIVAADGDGQSYSLDLPGVRIDAGNGPAHRHRCLRELALHARAPEPPPGKRGPLRRWRERRRGAPAP